MGAGELQILREDRVRTSLVAGKKFDAFAELGKLGGRRVDKFTEGIASTRFCTPEPEAERKIVCNRATGTTPDQIMSAKGAPLWIGGS
jgi:hypothetical protein